MEERSYEDALEAFRTLERQDGTPSSIVWQGRALKRLGRLREAIQVLDDGLRLRGAGDDSFRRAVTLWNLACYRTLLNASGMTPETVRSIVAVLDEAIQNAPDFRCARLDAARNMNRARARPFTTLPISTGTRVKGEMG